MIFRVVCLQLFLFLFGAYICPPAKATESLLIDDFSNNLQLWQEESFKGRNQYKIVEDDGGNRILQVRSKNSASALIQQKKIDPKEFPVLSWRWKIAGTIPSGDARIKNKDDYPARIYIIFPHWLKPLSRTINYIWANRLPVGENVPSPYFQRSVMLAVETGNKKAGQWVMEERNVAEDYRKLFGEEPTFIGGIAIMSDTDDTGEEAQAWYDDLVFKRQD